jgi:hypothetical protein
MTYHDLPASHKIVAVHCPDETRNVLLMFFNHALATNITKTVWIVHTTTA